MSIFVLHHDDGIKGKKNPVLLVLCAGKLPLNSPRKVQDILAVFHVQMCLRVACIL